MHFIVCLHHVRVHIQKQFVSTNLLHDKHFFAHVTWVPKQIFKVLISVGKMVMLVSITIIMSQHGCTMLWPWVFSVNINEKTLVLNNDCVVHWINLFSIIEPSLMCHIIPQLANPQIFCQETQYNLGSFKSPLPRGVCTLWWPYMDTTMVIFHVFLKYKKNIK
jgi:hypothetical protein